MSSDTDRQPADAATLIDILRWRGRHQADTRAFLFLADGEDDERPLTYRQLDQHARAIATELVNSGATGCRALLVYDSGLDYLAALYGCLYAGVIAVPVYPPDPFRVERTLPRLRSIVNDAGATWLLATEETLNWARPLFRKVPGLTQSMATDRVVEANTGDSTSAVLPTLKPTAPALLQYTSGSTGMPRGVTITHANLMANLHSIHATVDREDNIAAFWLPAYHDMGLIGGIFQPVFSGRLSVFMSPVSFMQRPVRWLQAISRHRATITAAPNFAYDLCVRKVNEEDRAALDLSCLRSALNGAEIVRPETLDRFAEAFAGCGFRRDAFYPCYGLAEATLMVAGGVVGTPPVVRSFSLAGLERKRALPPNDADDTRQLVGCGHAVVGQRVLVVDPDSRRALDDGQVGEIWVAGQSIGQGYWNRPEESAVGFEAELADGGKGRFMRTGDLGFIDQGELFIAGRRKEMIIVQGRNHYPHDIEETICRSHPLLKADGGAAFSIEVAGEERLAVVQEVMRPKKVDPAALIELIRSQIAEVHGVVPAAVTLIPAGTLPKTSSGKKQRRGCSEQFLSDSLPAIGQWRDERLFGASDEPLPTAVEPRTETEKKLAAIWSDVMGLATIDVHSNFFDLGGQSLLAGQLAARIQEEFAVELPLRALFANPTIANLAARLDAPGEQRSNDTLPPLTRCDRSQPIPLASSQEQLWFLEQLESEPRYNLTATVLVRGKLDVGALERSLAAIVARHEALRTTFLAQDGQPRQVVAPREVANPKAILSDAKVNLEANSAFDLSVGPLLRVFLERISADEQRLTIVAHHLICDGWSLAIFLREVAALYAAEVERRTCSLEDVVWQHADFAAWQQSCLATPQVARELDYWKDRLKGVQPLELVTDRQRSARAEFRAGSVAWKIDQSLADALRALGRQNGATLYMVLLAAFQTLLARYSRQLDVCVGSPVSYRPRRELEGTIGYFVNTLAMRTDLSGEPTFRELLQRVRETVLDALANGDAPLPAVVDVVAPRREAGRTPLFNVMFVFENLPWQAVDAAGISLGEIEIDHSRIGSYDLGCVVEEQAGLLKAALVYNADLFDATTLEPMAAALQSLLTQIVDNADRSVMCLPVIVEREGSAAAELEGRNGGNGAGNLSQAAIPLGFLSAASQPQAVAIVNGRTTITYRELDERANQLAHYLQGLGVGPEVPVAILLDRSVEMVVAMLAVLKAGGAYVPFDPHEATGRLQAMLTDTRPRAIITCSQFVERLPQHTAEEVVLDREAGAVTQYPLTPPHHAATPETLAYIIYTSGSSGNPKGVEVTRAALDNMTRTMAEQYDLSPSDRVLQIISPAFDVAGEEIFPTLLRGAALVLGPPSGELTGRDILDVCRRERVSVAHLPPQIWQQCLREWEPADERLFEHLRVQVMGGEAPAADTLDRWLRMARGRVRILQEFGLTETSVTNLVYELPADLQAWPARRRLPIGRPIGGSTVFVLDEHQQPVPVGAPGELYIGGPGLARGYHGLPDATRERFVSVSTTEGASPIRLCRTGDLARRLPDGNIEFLGRIDKQVKLRGLRIEPGEIERVLTQHPTIGEAAVLVREDMPGVKRLVAYLVPANGHVAERGELRAWLRNRLPESMVPSVFMPINSLPLNHSHKLDRDALPAPPLETAGRSYVAPANENERILAEIWQDALKVERVGTQDNFFELGGDSILTIQVVARAREAGLHFAPRQLFEHQTIAELAAVEGSAAETTAEQGPVEGDVPLTPIQHWFLSDGVIDAHHFNQTVLLRVDGELDPSRLPQVLERLVDQHDALRLRFARGADGWRQWHGAADGAWPLDHFDLSSLPENERAAAVTAEASRLQATLDLERGPLARAAWFDLGSAGTRLLLVVHHLVVDAVSWKILLDDLTAVWRQLQDDRPPALPAKSTSFKHWAERLASYAQSAELEQEVAYWRALADLPVATLPRDAADIDANLQGDVEIVSRTWDPVRTAELLNEANSAYRTQTNEVLLAALQQALDEWSGGSVLIDVEGHGRTDLFGDVDLSRSVGWFTLWHPHRSPTIGLAAGSLLRQTKEALRGVPNRGIGFGVLRYLSPRPEVRASMAALPRPEVSFNYLGRMDDYVASGSLVAADEAVGPTRSPRARRSHLLEVNAFLLDGRLRIDWSYGRHIHRRQTIEQLAESFFDRLAGLVAHCLSPEAGGFTPSDFPLARLNEGDLDKLANLLGD
ncbi:MAG TPA: amino acid adenylation domain-containing protein [Pirellulales bacterium]|nr:amino acid adenylation domain-containing protein [Pirellulales bacterium]